MAASHIASVVNVHLRAFPNFFLSFLGPRFLKEFYAAFLHDPDGIALIAEDQRTRSISGVVVGVLYPEGFFSRLLKRRWLPFCLSSIIAVCRNPGIMPRLFRALFYRGGTPLGPPRALLSSIAVCPEAKSLGLGSMLLEHWVANVRNREGSGCYLTTDALGNDSVNKFYQRAGWRLDATFITQEGRLMNRYVIDFN